MPLGKSAGLLNDAAMDVKMPAYVGGMRMLSSLKADELKADMLIKGSVSKQDII